MTQEAAAQKPEENDGLYRTWTEIRKNRDRISRLGEVSSKKILMEISDTVLSFVEEVTGYLLQFRNWNVDSLADVDERLSALEEEVPPPLLDEEEADMISQAAGMLQAYAENALEGKNISAEARAQSEKAVALAKRLSEWVEQIVAEQEDTGEEEGDESEDAINASGANGAS